MKNQNLMLIQKSMAFVILFMGVSVAHAAVLIHDYQLNGNLDDALGGPSLIANGGTIGATGYIFGANQGLALVNGIDAFNYTIQMAYRFDKQDFVAKLIDTQNFTSDAGLYQGVITQTVNVPGGLGFWSPQAFDFVGGVPNDVLSPNVLVEVILSRNGNTNLVTGWVNNVQQFSFFDTAYEAVFSGPNGIVGFFQDDLATGGIEAEPGFVDYIKIYDGALSVPEPATLALMSLGLFGLGFNRRKRLS